MKIDLNQEFCDQIFKQILVEDWETIKKEIKRLNKFENRINHLEDIKYQKKIKKAYETIIRYTHSYDEANEIVGVENE